MYGIYVGSTATYDAHTDPRRGTPTHLALGYWEGVAENTALYNERGTDASITRHAQNIALETQNDQVLVIREASPIDAPEFRVSRVDATPSDIGYTVLNGHAYKYQQDDEGTLTAWLVDANGTVTSI